LEFAPDKWEAIDENKVYQLAKQGMGAPEVARKMRKSQRSVRRVIRRIEEATGEKLIITKKEWCERNRKITDEELINAQLQGMSRKEMKKKYGIGDSCLSKRIKKLIKSGVYPYNQQAMNAGNKGGIPLVPVK
jgi:transposase